MTAEEILRQDKEREKRIKRLKENSTYWPKLYREESVNEFGSPLISFSTLVRIERGGIWYTVHAVESYIKGVFPVDGQCLGRMINSVHNIQNLYQITGQFEDVDTCQLSEPERLKMGLPNNFSTNNPLV